MGVAHAADGNFCMLALQVLHGHWDCLLWDQAAQPSLEKTWVIPLTVMLPLSMLVHARSVHAPIVIACSVHSSFDIPVPMHAVCTLH